MTSEIDIRIYNVVNTTNKEKMSTRVASNIAL